MNIRHAEPEDSEQIHDVALKSWKDTYIQILSEEAIEEVVEAWYDIDKLEEQVEDPIFYVAEEDENLIGFVHASVEDSKATLHRIYLKPKYQGQGVGSKLYQKVEKDVRDKKADKIELEVLAENQKGVRFYQKQGFKEKKSEEIDFKGEEVEQKTLIKNLEAQIT